MPAHRDLTGADLHEPKGVAAASAGTIYAADGGGSGSWQKVTTSNIDTASVFSVNNFFLTCTLDDVSTASSVYIAIPVNCTFVKGTAVLHGALATADSIVTFHNNAGSSMGTGMTVAFSGSAAGDIDTFTPTSNNTFTANQSMRVTTDGASANTVKLSLTLEFTRTA